METEGELAGALAALQRRSPEELAAFIVSLLCGATTLPAVLYRPSPSSTFRRDRTDCRVALGTVQSGVALRALVSIVRSW